MEININKMCSISINKCFAHTYNFWIYESAALCIQNKKMSSESPGASSCRLDRFWLLGLALWVGLFGKKYKLREMAPNYEFFIEIKILHFPG